MFTLHTCEIMRVALPMHERLGFRRVSSAPAIHGVAYGVSIRAPDG